MLKSKSYRVRVCCCSESFQYIHPDVASELEGGPTIGLMHQQHWPSLPMAKHDQPQPSSALLCLPSCPSVLSGVNPGRSCTGAAVGRIRCGVGANVVYKSVRYRYRRNLPWAIPIWPHYRFQYRCRYRLFHRFGFVFRADLLEGVFPQLFRKKQRNFESRECRRSKRSLKPRPK